MKVEILTDGEPYVLIDGGLESPENPFGGDCEDQVQLAPAVRAQFIRVYNRGNRVVRLPLRKTRTYESVRAAELAILEHPHEIPTEGTIKITTEADGETPGYERYLLDGTVHSIRWQQLGRSVIWDYTITAGRLSDSEPS